MCPNVPRKMLIFGEGSGAPWTNAFSFAACTGISHVISRELPGTIGILRRDSMYGLYEECSVTLNVRFGCGGYPSGQLILLIPR